MPTITTPVYRKPNSGTNVQKTLKDDVYTYFTKIAISNDGTGSLVIDDGASKGTIALLSPANGAGAGEYTIVYPAQQAWLGSPAVSVKNNSISNNGGAGELYVAYTEGLPSVDLATQFGLDIVGIGSSSVGAIRVITYHISGSTEPAPANLPSGSFIYVTAFGTQSPVF